MSVIHAESDGYVSPIDEEDDDISQVAEFYRGRSVFITGVTGFVGKVLLEKLLRSCPRIRNVYVLLRSKDGQSPRQRLDELLTCQVFCKIKHENPSILTKIVPISGDICAPDLGISQSDTSMLLKNVSVVFHSAATVRFDEPLRKSIEVNVVGTERVLQLCHKMTQIAALIHVSTAYSYCNRKEVDEIVYKEKVSPQKVIDIAEWMDESLLESFLPKLMDGRPTTYHYSKAMAENLLVSDRGDVPVAIVRPSIVTAAYKEPMPGWVDGVNGPSAFIIMTGRGLLRTMLVYEGTVVDWIPVDLLANVLLTAAWHIGTHKPNSVKVFNCTSGNLNRVTWSDIERTAYPLIIKHPSLKILRYPGGSFKSSPFLNKLSIKLEHSLPAHVIDALSSIIGLKTEYVSMVRRMERAAGYLQYFTTKEWTFRSNNYLHLRELQSARDRKEFDIDIRPIEWTPYLESYVLGVRKYILGEDDSTLPAARKKINRLYYAGILGQVSVLLGVLYILLKRTNLSHYLLWGAISLSFRIMQHMPDSWIRYLNSA
ncbi:putative fatty acyl-CoA reductase CG5065 [Parasteatoda tepidariorum]|uniref:putative fatty acyl-CoA reductase CG5065 n=1 Tax=Parasteatoda tepidariorum TaxID=114398 RepID=UPI00077F9DC6|nr:putative fatty acyl-CoA reductase CG5065 [Parasteatoda tepidariorum]